MKAKLMIWILFLFVLVFGVTAANPHTPQMSGASGFQIDYPKQPYFLAENPIDFYIHVYDPNNFQVSAPKVNCTIDIYNITDNHVIEKYLMVMDSNGVDYEIVLGTNITSVAGRYPYIIYCSNLTVAGFVSDFFEIEYGAPREDSVSGSPLAIIILIPLLFGALLMLGSFHLDDEHKVIKIIMFLFAYVMVFISFWFGMQTLVRYYYFAGMQDGITTAIWVTGIGLFVILSYFLIYAFVMGINAAAQRKRDKLGW